MSTLASAVISGVLIAAGLLVMRRYLWGERSDKPPWLVLAFVLLAAVATMANVVVDRLID